MITTKGYVAHSAEDILAPWQFERREPGPKDVLIKILYSGICHSDIHQVKSEWGKAFYPIVPGHEIIGRIESVGAEVTKFKVGDLAGIGCMVNSCGECYNCKNGQEQFCQKGKTVYTYNSKDVFHDDTITYGGYSEQIVADESFVLHVSEKLDISKAAPLLCAGITTYSPLKRWKVGKGHKLGVLGLGGLGHMAVKFGVAFGAEVTLISHSPSKEKDAKRLGAHHFCNTNDPEQVNAMTNSLDFIIDTVSAPYDYNLYLQMLKVNGVQICVGLPPKPIEIYGRSLMGGNRALTASSIGGIQETQEMLDFCAAHNVLPDVEIVPINYVNEAYKRVLASDVKYRFVIDMATLQ